MFHKNYVVTKLKKSVTYDHFLCVRQSGHFPERRWREVSWMDFAPVPSRQGWLPSSHAQTVLFQHAHCTWSNSTAHSLRRSPDIMWTNANQLYILPMDVSSKMSSIGCLCWKRHPKVLKHMIPFRDDRRFKNWCFFWKSSKGGGGHFQSKKLHCRFCWFQSGIFWS